MTHDDLMHIFKEQIDEGTTNLYFIVQDGETKTLLRQQLVEIDQLLIMLDTMVFVDYKERIPRFTTYRGLK